MKLSASIICEPVDSISSSVIAFSQYLLQYDTVPRWENTIAILPETSSTSDWRVPISRRRSVREIRLYNYSRYSTINERREGGDLSISVKWHANERQRIRSRPGHLWRNRRRTTRRIDQTISIDFSYRRDRIPRIYQRNAGVETGTVRCVATFFCRRCCRWRQIGRSMDR